MRWLCSHYLDRLHNHLLWLQGHVQDRSRVIVYRIGWLCRYTIQLLRVFANKMQVCYWHVRDGLTVRVVALRRRLAGDVKEPRDSSTLRLSR